MLCESLSGKTLCCVAINGDFFILVQGVGQTFDFPTKNPIDTCTIMYTSGTTGDPKGVMITNESILSIISGVDHHLESLNEPVNLMLYYFV